ncbi:MAG: hypothetical protein HZA52_20755 [Planctomycetes bacterium]|nr:hypothetical protein [Planctomycetota bacterium]
MFTKYLTAGVALGVLAGSAFAQASPVYTSGPDYMGWPTDTPNGLVKFVAADVTPDDLDDAFALYGTNLYLVHSPAAYPRWELVTSGVSDFAVVKRHGGRYGAVISTAAGLSLATWSTSLKLMAIPGTDSMSNLALLNAFDESSGANIVAGRGSATRVVFGRLTGDGLWSQFNGVTETQPITGLALADLGLTAGAELATISGGVLRVRSQTGTLQVIPGMPTEVGAKVFRLAGGGDVSTEDSFGYVTASSQAGSLQVVYEVFGTGVNYPTYTGPYLIESMQRTKPWTGGKAAIIIQTSNTGEIFRFQDNGGLPGQVTLITPTTTAEFQTYWYIPVTAAQIPNGGPILGGKMACADFDADGLDDVLVASNEQRFNYLFPAVDDPFRLNGIHHVDTYSIPPIDGGKDGSRRGGAATDSTTVVIGIQAQVNQFPRGFTAPNGVNTVQVTMWVREGGAGTFVSLPGSVQRQPLNLTGPNQFLFDATTNVLPDDTLVYFQVRGLNVQGTTVVQSSTPVSAVTVLGGAVQQNATLCDVFTVEPDMYSEENRGLNGCGSGGFGDGPVILGGFNRRSNVGPFVQGTGSPGWL